MTKPVWNDDAYSQAAYVATSMAKWANVAFWCDERRSMADKMIARDVADLAKALGYTLTPIGKPDVAEAA